MKALRVVLSCSILFITSAFAMEVDKENIPDSSNRLVVRERALKSKETQPKAKKSISGQVRSIEKDIQNSRTTFDAEAIKKAWEKFDGLQASEKQWEKIATKARAIKWPSQKTWKDVVGGHFFFPTETIEWDSEDVESYKLARIDSLWSLMVAANYDHAMAKFYFAKTLKLLNVKNTSDFRETLFRQAYHDFIQCHNNSEVCYVVGEHYSLPHDLSDKYMPEGFSVGEKTWQSEVWYKGNIGNFNESDMAWHIKGRNELAVLELRRRFRRVYDLPSEEEYRALSKVRFAARLIEDKQKKVDLLLEAASKNDAIAWIDLGDLSSDLNRLDKAREYYQKAGEEGIVEGYIRLGLSYVGDTTNEYIMTQYPLKNYTEDERNKGIEAFQKAGKLGHYQGYDFLAMYHAQLLKQGLSTLEESKPLMEEALQKGLRLGSLRCNSYVGDQRLNIKKNNILEKLFEYIQSYNK